MTAGDLPPRAPVPLDLTPASPADLATIAAVLEDARRWLAGRAIAQWPRPFADASIAEKIAAGEFWVARLDGWPVAVVRLLWADPLFWGEREQGDAVYVHTLAVRRDHAGRGIGALVLRWAEGRARARRRRFLRLDYMADNRALVGYYEREGFALLGPARIGAATVMLLEKAVDF